MMLHQFCFLITDNFLKYIYKKGNLSFHIKMIIWNVSFTISFLEVNNKDAYFFILNIYNQFTFFEMCHRIIITTQILINTNKNKYFGFSFVVFYKNIFYFFHNRSKLTMLLKFAKIKIQEPNQDIGTNDYYNVQ